MGLQLMKELYDKFHWINQQPGKYSYKTHVTEELKDMAQELKNKFDDNCSDRKNIEAMVMAFNTGYSTDINASLATGDNEKFQHFLLQMIENLKTRGKEVAYDDLKEPLYKGVPYNRYKVLYGDNMERLKNFGIYNWPSFSMTSKDKSAASVFLEEED